MASYRISQNAWDDLIRIHQHGVNRYSVLQADKYYDAFFYRFEEIAKQPYLYQSVDYIHNGYRRCVCGVDSIFYRVIDGTVEIVSILIRAARYLQKSLK